MYRYVDIWTSGKVPNYSCKNLRPKFGFETKINPFGDEQLSSHVEYFPPKQRHDRFKQGSRIVCSADTTCIVPLSVQTMVGFMGNVIVGKSSQNVQKNLRHNVEEYVSRGYARNFFLSLVLITAGKLHFHLNHLFIALCLGLNGFSVPEQQPSSNQYSPTLSHIVQPLLIVTVISERPMSHFTRKRKTTESNIRWKLPKLGAFPHRTMAVWTIGVDNDRDTMGVYCYQNGGTMENWTL